MADTTRKSANKGILEFSRFLLLIGVVGFVLQSEGLASVGIGRAKFQQQGYNLTIDSLFKYIFDNGVMDTGSEIVPPLSRPWDTSRKPVNINDNPTPPVVTNDKINVAKQEQQQQKQQQQETKQESKGFRDMFSTAAVFSTLFEDQLHLHAPETNHKQKEELRTKNLGSYLMDWTASSKSRVESAPPIPSTQPVTSKPQPKNPQVNPNDVDIVNVLTALYKSAIKGSASSARLLRKLVSLDEDLTGGEKASESPTEAIKTVVEPLESILGSKARTIFNEQEVELEPISPFLVSLQSSTNSISSSILSSFFNALATSPTGENSDNSNNNNNNNKKNNGAIFVDYFEKQKDGSSPSSLDGFLQFVSKAAAEGVPDATKFIADVNSSPPKHNEVKNSGNIFLDFTPDSTERANLRPLLNYLLNATNFGSLYAADIVSQYVDSSSPPARTGGGSMFLEQEPKGHQPKTLGSFFANENTQSKQKSVDPNEEAARVLGSLGKASVQGHEAAKQLFSKMSWLDQILVKGSEPRIAAVVESVNEKAAATQNGPAVDPVAPFLLNVKKMADEGSAVGSTILKSFFSILAGHEDSPSIKSADQVLSEYFTEAMSAQTQVNDEDALARFFKFVEDKVISGSKPAVSFAQTLNNAFVSESSGGNQKNTRATFKSMFIDSLEEANHANTSSGMNEFIKYITRGSSYGNTASTGLFAEMLVSAKDVKSKEATNSIFVKQDDTSSTTDRNAINLLKDLSQFSFETPNDKLHGRIVASLAGIKNALVSTLVGKESELRQRNFETAKPVEPVVTKRERQEFKPIFIQNQFRQKDPSEKSDLDSIKSKWNQIMSSYNDHRNPIPKSNENYLQAFFVSQSDVAQDNGEPVKLGAATFLGSMKAAALQGSNAAQTLMSKLAVADTILASKTDVPLSKIVDKVNEGQQSVWIQQEPVAPLLMELKTSIGFGDKLSSEILKKFFQALVASDSESKSDSKLFADYFQSSHSKDTNNDPVNSFFSYIKDGFQGGNGAATQFVNSLSHVFTTHEKVKPSTFESIFSTHLKNQKSYDSADTPVDNFVRYLSKATTKGNPTSASLLADILVTSNSKPKDQRTSNSPVFAYENDAVFGLMDNLSKMSLDNPSIDIIADSLKRLKSGLSSYLVSGSDSTTTRSATPVQSPPQQQQQQQPISRNTLKSFFVQQNQKNGEFEEPKNPFEFFRSMTDAAMTGSQSSQTLLSSLWAVDTAVSKENEEKLANLWPQVIKKAATPPSSTSQRSSIWVNNEPVTPLIQNLKQSAESGDLIASGLLQKFFQALVSSGSSSDPSVNAADAIFGEYFAHASSIPKGSETGGAEPIDEFLKFFKSRGYGGPAGTLKSSLAGMLANEKARPPSSFQDIFLETFQTPPPPLHAQSKSTANEFVNYMYRPASNGSPAAASFLSDMFVSGKPLFANTQVNSFNSIFQPQPGMGARGSVGSGAGAFVTEPSGLLTLLADISKLSVNPRSSPTLQSKIADGLKAMKAQLAGKEEFTIFEKQQPVFQTRKDAKRDTWALNTKMQVPKIIHNIMVDQDARPQQRIAAKGTQNNQPSPRPTHTNELHGVFENTLNNIFPGLKEPASKPKASKKSAPTRPSAWSSVFVPSQEQQAEERKGHIHNTDSDQLINKIYGIMDFTRDYFSTTGRTNIRVNNKDRLQVKSNKKDQGVADSEKFSRFLDNVKESIGDTAQHLLPFLASDSTPSVPKPRYKQTHQSQAQNQHQHQQHQRQEQLKRVIKPVSQTRSSWFSIQSKPPCDSPQLINGGFENGKLTHWTTVREPASEGDVVVVQSGESLGYSGANAVTSLSDLPMAVFDNEGAGSYVLYRDFVPVEGDVLVFQWQVINTTPTFSIQMESMSMQLAPNQQFKVDLFDVAGSGGFDWFGEDAVKGDGSLLAHVVNAQTVKAHDNDGWQETRFDLSQFAGINVRLAFRLVNNQDILTAALHNVSIQNKRCVS
ncbi:hypothetical protein BDR26DRAFT_852100 [Obelidium mucronatum]|nr:hypothetical protein BDR26DRAFT_852100 [Obelidium mucronatum]